MKVHADVVFGPARIAVFVDGCFWHSCPEHQHVPKRNHDYWEPKFAANVARDRRVDAALADAGWLVRRVWEHEDAETVAASIAATVTGRRAVGTSGGGRPSPDRF